MPCQFGQAQAGVHHLFGPFAEYDDAYEFSEQVRRDEEEWKTMQAR